MLKRNASSESGNEGLDADVNPPLVRSNFRARNILLSPDSGPNATCCSDATFGALHISPGQRTAGRHGLHFPEILQEYLLKEVVAYS